MLRRLVLATPRLFLWQWAYRLVIAFVAWRLRRTPGVETVYLSRGAGTGHIEPGISDLDFTVIGTAPALQRRYARWRRLFPMLDRTLEVYSRKDVDHLYAFSPYHRFRFAEAHTRLSGPDVFATLPKLEPWQLLSACVNEAQVWWQYIEEDRGDVGRLYDKAVRELTRLAEALEGKPLAPSRHDVTPAAPPTLEGVLALLHRVFAVAEKLAQQDAAPLSVVTTDSPDVVRSLKWNVSDTLVVLPASTPPQMWRARAHEHAGRIVYAEHDGLLLRIAAPAPNEAWRAILCRTLDPDVFASMPQGALPCWPRVVAEFYAHERDLFHDALRDPRVKKSLSRVEMFQKSAQLDRLHDALRGGAAHFALNPKNLPLPSAPPRAECTVIVVTKDRPAMLDRLLRSLATQTVAPHEILVVEDALSTASYADVLARHAVRHVRHDVPGIAANRNRGWREARTDIVLFADDDCIADPHWVERVTAAMARDERIGALGGEIEADPPRTFVAAYCEHEGFLHRGKSA